MKQGPISRFESVGELVSYVETGYPTAAMNRLANEFVGNFTWEQTRDAALNGYNANRASIDAMIETLKSTVAETVELGFREQFDVAGSYVDMGRFVTGEPECMVQSVLEPVPRQGKITKILVDSSFLASVNSQTVFKRGAALVAMVELMRLMGQNVELWAEASSSSPNYSVKGTHTTIVLLKPATDPLDIEQVAFALCHPSFFRRMIFGVRDRDGIYGWTHADGYGSSEPPQMVDEIEPDLILAKPDNSQSYDAKWIIQNLRSLGLID